MGCGLIKRIGRLVKESKALKRIDLKDVCPFNTGLPSKRELYVTLPTEFY
jgi:hypothetical protein